MIKPDWQYIKTSFLTFVICLIVSTVLCLYSHWQESLAVDNYQQLEQNHAAARRKSTNADSDRELYEQYFENFINYSKHGYIGNEQRLNWIEQLRLIDDNLGLIAMQYEISPQENIVPVGVEVKSENVSIQQSRMNLKVELLHEGDFVKLLSSLRQEAKGFYALSKCDLYSKMNKRAPQFNPEAGNLSAECELDWYTINVKG